MKSKVVAVLLSACAMVCAVQIQAAEEPADWLREWQMTAKQLTDVAGAMPAEKYDYKPVPEVQPFGEQLKHAMVTMKLLFATAQGEKADAQKVMDDVKALDGKEAITAELTKTLDTGAMLIKKMMGKNDGEVIDTYFGKTTRRFLLLHAIAHNNNHYGQLVTHLRLNGIAPPASRR